jgi:uncharacterized membrane protein SirB2
VNALKLAHVLCAAISIGGFALRGWWMFRDSPRLQQRWARIAPHVNDSALLLTGVWMMIATGQYPPGRNWLAAKLTAVVVYIVLGMAAFRFVRHPVSRAAAFMAALAVFGYVVAVAATRDPALGLR